MYSLRHAQAHLVNFSSFLLLMRVIASLVRCDKERTRHHGLVIKLLWWLGRAVLGIILFLRCCRLRGFAARWNDCWLHHLLRVNDAVRVIHDARNTSRPWLLCAAIITRQLIVLLSGLTSILFACGSHTSLWFWITEHHFLKVFTIDSFIEFLTFILAGAEWTVIFSWFFILNLSWAI